jgi:hypothetical protein
VPGVGASARAVVARGFTHVEDVLYVGLGALLAGAALVLLAEDAAMFWRTLIGGELPARCDRSARSHPAHPHDCGDPLHRAGLAA